MTADLTVGALALAVNKTRVRECRACKRGIHVGRPVVIHSPVATSHVRDYYHPDCVEIP